MAALAELVIKLDKKSLCRGLYSNDGKGQRDDTTTSMTISVDWIGPADEADEGASNATLQIPRQDRLNHSSLLGPEDSRTQQ